MSMSHESRVEVISPVLVGQMVCCTINKSHVTKKTKMSAFAHFAAICSHLGTEKMRAVKPVVCRSSDW